MPITITLPVDGSPFGPGLLLSASSSEPIPDPGSRRWAIAIEAEGGFPLTQHFVFEHGNTLRQYFLINQGQFGLTLNVGLQQPIHGQPYRVLVEHEDQGIVTASASTAITWDGQSGLGLQAFQQRTAAASGGFTETDRALLTAVDGRTQLIGEPGSLQIQNSLGTVATTLSEIFSRSTLDRLTLQELTSGETCDPVRVDISFSWFHAIIVRVTTIAEDLVPKTPDHEWYFPDLAVLRIFRGADLEFRRGIHTPTFIQERPWQWGWQFLNVVPILGTPPETNVAVDWRPGCCGRVYGMFLN